jgi:hypothetical protein
MKLNQKREKKTCASMGDSQHLRDVTVEVSKQTIDVNSKGPHDWDELERDGLTCDTACV